MEEPPVHRPSDDTMSPEELLDKYLYEPKRERKPARVSFEDFVGALENVPKKRILGFFANTIRSVR